MKTQWTSILLVVVAGACTNLGSPTGSDVNYGFLELDGSSTAGGQVTGAPQALFFRTAQLLLPDSHSPQDQCLVQPIPGSSGTVGSVTTRPIAAGDSVALSLDSATRYLKLQTNGNQAVYSLPNTGKVTYAPGALLRLTTPGAPSGFPAASDTVTTAEPFTVDSLPVTATSDRTITLRWTPPPHPGSKLFVELRYAATGTTPTDEIACDLSDGGSFTIPSAATTGYFTANPQSHHNTVTRLRTAADDLGGGNTLFLLSTYAVTVPSASAAVAQR